MAKKRWPKASKSFPLPIYGGTVYLFRDRETFNKAIDFLGGKVRHDMLLGEATHWENEKGESIWLIGWYNEELSVLIHEMTHIAIFVLNHVGIDPRDSGGEALCYLVGYLFEKLTENK